MEKEVKIDLENLEFVETSIVGEVEIWIDTTTNKYYEIPIEIHRDFNMVAWDRYNNKKNKLK